MQSMSGKNSNVTNCVIPSEVSMALQQLPIIQHSLRDIQLQLTEINSLKSTVSQLKAEIWEADGIDHRLANTSDQTQENTSDIELLKSFNSELREEVDLLKSVVIKLDKKVREQEGEIIDLKSRSMRENILIHGLAEEKGENLKVRVNELLQSHLGIDVKFVRIHRNGGKPGQAQPRSITGRLVDYEQKDQILKLQRSKINSETSLPFRITPQSPPAVNENRKKLLDLNSKYRTGGVNTRVVGNKLIYPSGKVYNDKVTVPTAKDVLCLDQNDRDKLNEIPSVETEVINDNGNKFLAICAPTDKYMQVRNLYKKVCGDPRYAGADHKIMAYRFRDEQGELHESYCDDNEHGAGRRILKKLKDNNKINVSVVVVRFFSGTHIGPRRFSIMENLAMEATRQLTC